MNDIINQGLSSTIRPAIRLKPLEGVRGLAALYVTCSHAFPLGNTGWVGIDVFFVLSGFVLMLPMALAGGTIRGGLGGYAWRRARRILPPYYAAIVFSLVVSRAPWRWDDLLAHVAMVHNLRDCWITSINGSFWSLGFEWQLYFLLPLVILPIWRVLGSSGVCLACFGLATVPEVVPFQHLLAAPASLFSLGVAAAGVVSGAEKPRVIALASPALAFAPSCSLAWGHAVVGAAAAFAIVLVAREPDGAIGRILSLPPLLWLGAISYSLYLTHFPLVPLLPTSLVIPTCLVVASLFYMAFERPTLRIKNPREA